MLVAEMIQTAGTCNCTFSLHEPRRPSWFKCTEVFQPLNMTCSWSAGFFSFFFFPPPRPKPLTLPHLNHPAREHPAIALLWVQIKLRGKKKLKSSGRAKTFLAELIHEPSGHQPCMDFSRDHIASLLFMHTTTVVPWRSNTICSVILVKLQFSWFSK